MCGIAGVYYFDRARPVHADLVVPMADALVHRGPDGGGVWTASGVGLGHRRLSIIDLAGGTQPMFDRTGRYVVVFNGEIYNYRELRVQLEGLGSSFATDSDTEVLLEAYAQWGQAAVDRFNGMFAFALYDRLEHSLWLVRDRLGKKPLYIYRDKERIAFGSELKALFADPSIPREIEPSAVADFFALAYVPGAKTILRRVEKLPAGHAARVTAQGVHIHRYWDVRFGEVIDDKSPSERAEELAELLRDAIRLRMRSDVPLGAFLSGGLDSSAVVALMAELSETSVLTQAIGFDVARFDERRFAAEIARKFDTAHREKVLAPKAGLTMRQLSYFYDEPFGDSSAIPTYHLCEQTREAVTVALSGDGGDELFAGYDHYPVALWSMKIHERLPQMAWAAARPALSLGLQASRFLRRLHRNNLLLWRASQSRERAAFNNLLPQPWRYRELVGGSLLASLRDYDPFDALREHYESAQDVDALSMMQYVDLKAYLCDDILVKVDRASMAHALEVRCPLLDYRIVEFAARIPADARRADGKSKAPLRAAIADRIDPTFFDREKQGFAIPAGHWFRTALKTSGGRMFFSRRGGQSGLLDPLGLRRLWSEHQVGAADHGAQLYNAMMFEHWFERYIDRVAEPIEPTAAMQRAAPTQTMNGPAFEGRADPSPP